ncbi:helix-turn-helix transcriptional regulator [Polyangium jinanense]|uniref:WYL domain-containing protein n=1 Tax=Polyangium jinanense TaxID=2829994 RepID=A0A9X4ANT4_9BACT|nr:WYL domain-containing protein [Polyangium jinanense]MDC3953570.1 WYL domain-containing protein [Polyangium jinanense]MDC3979309.1 WYL domain-containing protein [Polyangium jinanense]
MLKAAARSGGSRVEDVAKKVLRLLQREESVPIQQMQRGAGASEKTIKRAIEWLRDRGAEVPYVAALRGYQLVDRTFSLPLTDPSNEDLQAILTAAGLLQEVGQGECATRAWALFRGLAERVGDGKKTPIRGDALRVTQRSAMLREPRWVLELLRAVRREVVSIEYRSPWANELKLHRIEPWQVWLHDGVFYVRGYSQLRKAPRTFRLANVTKLTRLSSEKPTAAVPADPWSEGDPRYGIDEDRPGVAIVRFRGPVARWISEIRWHPEQKDAWVAPDEVLERCVPYRSVREFARHLLGVIDGLDAVEPPALRERLVELASQGIASLTRSDGSGSSG